MNQSVAKPIATGSRRDLQHGFPPVIDTVYSFDDAKAGLNHFATRQLFGKVAIRH